MSAPAAPPAAGTVGEALTASRAALAAAGVGEPALDSSLLLAAATGLDRAALIARPETPVDPASGRRFRALLRRRLERQPLAYVLGRRGFRRIELEVDSRALIPRPETELLVELALELGPASVLDVGTGSGAIALAVADELPGARVTATDTSAAALDLARANAARLGLADRVSFAAGSLPPGDASFDLVLANLPYVADGEWASLAPEIRRWEPREALLGGPDGLGPIRGLIASLAPSSGTASAAAVGLEIGAEQGERRRRAARRRRLRGDRSPPRPRRPRSVRRRAGAGVSATILPAGPEARAELERTIAAGGVALFCADGLYGLACDPLSPLAIERIHAIKGRDDGKPSAVMYFSPLAFRELLPSLGERSREALAAPAARPRDGDRRQSAASLPARLPLHAGGARRASDRGAARGGDVPGLPNQRQPFRRARSGHLRRRRRRDRRGGRSGDRRWRARRGCLRRSSI